MYTYISAAGLGGAARRALPPAAAIRRGTVPHLISCTKLGYKLAVLN